MAPPKGYGGRGPGKTKGRGKGGVKDGGGRGARGTRVRNLHHRGRSGPEGNPENEELYTDVDRFHMQKDMIKFADAEGDSTDCDDLDGSEQEEAVMDLDGIGGASSDGNDDDSEEDDSDESDLPELPEHVRRAAMEASSDESEEDGEERKRASTGWGKSRSSYYNADTADLEIGQEFEDAEAEEEAALELQRASYKRLDPADYGEEGEEEAEEGVGEGEEGGDETTGKKSAKKGRPSGAALLAMKADLEQIALGAGNKIETSVVKRDTSKLSRGDKLELVLSEAPELPTLFGEVREQLEILTEAVQPLVSNVTADIGASKDGLVYLRTRQQLLLAYCMNVCFYMILKAKGEPAKGHPVVRRLLSLRALLEDMSVLDGKMSSQVDILLRALKSGVELAGTESGSEDREGEGTSDDANGKGALVVAREGKLLNAGGGSGGGRDGWQEEDMDGEVDEEDLEEEEARFMGGDGGGGSSKQEDVDDEIEAEQQGLSKATRKKRRRLAREQALAAARAKLAAGDGTGDASLGDFGDEDIDDANDRSAKKGRGGGANILQGMINRISQRDKATTARKGRDLQGDLDVPVRERDQTIRVRRPAPGEESGSESGEDGRFGSGSGSEDDDLMGGAGGGGFMDGLPPGLLEGLSRRGGANGGVDKRKKNGSSMERKRQRHDGGEVGKAGGEEDDFYTTVAVEKEHKKLFKKEKYNPQPRIAGALEAELEAERVARGETKRGASYTIIKNRGLTPHKNKLNRNPRTKKREAFRKATIRRKGQVRDIRTGEADTYGGESTGIKSNVTRSRKLKG